MAAKVANTSTGGSAGQGVVNSAINGGSQAAGQKEFQDQLEALAATSLAMAQRSVVTRTVVTELQSVKKVADERVQ
ncbi:hypothetical protein [Microvirga vignae]|uniref:hypothetical protein n=1 Tax=Microvirga vignae TaxID=1225564 RepID=UPI0012378FCC|nr:hypothetical protein [Microvirga vignae]